jgi:hypothetical protein
MAITGFVVVIAKAVKSPLRTRTVFLRLHFAVRNVVACLLKETAKTAVFGVAANTPNAQLPIAIVKTGQSIDIFFIEIAQKNSRSRWRD